MARAKSKKVGDPKCRGCSGMIEGRSKVIIDGKKWHVECAKKAGKKIPKEYQKVEE